VNTFHALKYLYLDRNKFGRCLKKSYLSGRCYLPRSKLPTFTEPILRDFSEELVQDLGVRDELEFEKVARAAPIGRREIPRSSKNQW
jgi:hypothetical protein